jgi:hypothetical protein
MRVCKWLWIALVTVSSAWAQAPAKSGSADPFAALSFLQGTWDAKASGQGAAASGTYTFRLELGGHVLARHSTSQEACKGPATFDCEHGDLLYVYPEGSGLKAIYFDNEGHTIHYDVTTPEPGTVVFLSEASPGPQFRLMYVLKGDLMSGKFQMKMPGGSDWQSYLEWTGGKSKS